ncbi:MAG TPA: RNA polymerase sigma factor [Ktedonobacterales bacterium]
MRGDPQPLADETDAIRRCQQGDIAALGALVTHYQTPAVRLAYLLTGDQDLANDIAQDSFLLAWRGIRRFRLGEPFAPWFYRIVTNSARQQMRSARYRREVSLEALVSDDPDARRLGVSLAATQASQADPEERAERAEAWAALLAALAALPQKQREAVVLRYYLGYTDRQAATILGCHVGAIQQRLHDGRASLQRAIRTRYPWLLRSLPTLSSSEP